jgi:hypothetical protein
MTVMTSANTTTPTARRYVVHTYGIRYFAIYDTHTQLVVGTDDSREAADRRARQLNGETISHTDLVKSSTCETCRNGCTCEAGTPGCEHYACWGVNPTGKCPEAVRLNAATLA